MSPDKVSHGCCAGNGVSVLAVQQQALEINHEGDVMIIDEVKKSIKTEIYWLLLELE